LYLAVKEEEPQRAEEVYRLLQWNGGNQSGIAVSCIDPRGFVHPDQFSWHISFGNIRERSFQAIWTDTSQEVVRRYKNRRESLKGRCRYCNYLEVCNGNLRVRAERYFGDFYGPDPACYLTDAEIGIRPGTPEAEEALRWRVPVQDGQQQRPGPKAGGPGSFPLRCND